MSKSLYEKLPDDLLVGFYVEINKNIEKGILTDAMYYELDLIEEIVSKRAIPLSYFEINKV